MRCTLTFDLDLDFQSQVSYGHDKHIHIKLKFEGQSVQQIEQKQMDGQTDVTDCLTFPANVVGNYMTSTVNLSTLNG